MLGTATIGKRVTSGFILLVVLTAGVGGMAVWNMRAVLGESQVLAAEYVPEVKFANEVERQAQLTMYAMRGYGLTDDPQLLAEARESLAEVRAGLEQCRQLADRATRLVKLEGLVQTCTDAVDRYTQLVDETVSVNAAMAELRDALDGAAAQFVSAATGFLHSQEQAMKEDIKTGKSSSELEERATKIALASQVLDTGQLTRIACFKAQALRDPELIRDANPNFDAILASIDQLREVTRLESDIKLLDQVTQAANAYKIEMNKLLEKFLSNARLGKQRDEVGSRVLAAARDTAVAGIEGTVAIADGSAAALSRSSNIVIGGVIGAMVLGVAIALVITRTLNRTLDKIITRLDRGSEQVSDASQQVASASQQLAEGAGVQASSLEETSSALEEMASITRNNAESAQKANELAEQARTAASAGDQTMHRLNNAMSAINESSGKISKIIKVIEEIAFQTNLLALNAAVEAARAGEHGKGFAVVADEVRNLAMRAAEAARETTGLIEDSVHRAQEGAGVAEEVAKGLEAIVRNVTDVSALIANIAKASEEQAQGVDQVNTAVSQMDRVTQQTAATAEESSSAAQELSAQSVSVKGVVDELIQLVRGRGDVAPTKHDTQTMKARLQAAKRPAAPLTKTKAAPSAAVAAKTPSSAKAVDAETDEFTFDEAAFANDQAGQKELEGF